ncbi:hypothetical protein M0R45_034000 [Rubus argutus]|uniref:Uncharacterized protein n=1 Tax=Rubus argutus TaxID=59490 RepID=A0AAW1VRY4_RUBAR
MLNNLKAAKCIAASYKLDTGSSVELTSRCLIEEVYRTKNHVEDITACFRHAIKPGIPLASNWPYQFKTPRNVSYTA